MPSALLLLLLAAADAPATPVSKPPTTTTTAVVEKLDLTASPTDCGPGADAGKCPIPAERIKAFFTGRDDRLRGCYVRELGKDLGLRGRLGLRFEVHADGHLEKVAVVENTVGLPRVAECFVRELEGASSELRPGRAVTVRYHFVLRSSR